MDGGAANSYLLRAIALVAALGLLGGALYVALTAPVRSSDISQELLYVRGTESEHADFSAWVKKRPVRIASSERRAVDVVSEYARRVMSGEVVGGVQGEYDTETGEIRILGDEVRIEAAFPEPLRANLYHTVRHEYGHAAMFQWLDEQGIDPADAAAIGLSALDGTPVPDRWPAEIVAVVQETATLESDVYGHPYLTSNLAEYLAESYARVLEGDHVPPRTRRFVLEAYRGVER